MKNSQLHSNVNPPLNPNLIMDKAQSEDYLHSLLNKTLRVTTDDTRMFMGRFRCTDSVRLSLSSPRPNNIRYVNFPPFKLLQFPSPNTNSLSQQDRNIILSQAFEYRFPSTTATSSSSAPTSSDPAEPESTSRYLGQVVVPGAHISKIELEEFVSQVKSAVKTHVGEGSGEGV
jgi:hypothetical protein